jgi:hypothetical protein
MVLAQKGQVNITPLLVESERHDYTLTATPDCACRIGYAWAFPAPD